MSYQEEFDKQCIENYKNCYNELRFMLAGDMDMLQQHFGWEEGETISDKMYEIDSNNNTFQMFTGFSINKDFQTQYARDDDAYVIFEVSSNEKWILGQNGDVAISYSEGQVHRFEGLGFAHEYSEVYEFVAARVEGGDFANVKIVPDEDELTERLKLDLGVDTAAEWLLQNADESNGEVISFKEFVGCLEENGYNAHGAVTYALDQGVFNVETWDGVTYGKDDFVADIEMHIETIERLKLQSDWDDVVSVFGLDDDDIVAFDKDDFEDELKREFPSNDEPEQKAKSTNKFKI
ncbi:TPA: hypothetical protein ACJXXT_000251 [Pseudomonas aeruginosa]|uniref:hypothetical protein n=1 Tax=Pseudomonas putida TaxID=303 RepID=UPI001BB0055E|nr:hypothetical protein [Pseudomonas putida]QUG90802.1 hypothetical protein GR140_19240 [Pseudomonas putida]